jgi:VWFA-related protein
LKPLLHLPLSRRDFLGAAALAAPLALRAQEPTFTTGVQVVNVLAIALDRNGRLVRDLGQDDFQLLEDGRPQTIRYFSRETDLPLTLGLLVDTSMSQRRLIDKERAGCYHFLDRVLRERIDKVFVMQFDEGVLLRQGLTSSRKDLEETLALVDTPTRNELRMGAGDGTWLYDAIVKASREIMAPLGNRKALIVLTDGVDFGSTATVPEAIEAALRADTLVCAVHYADPGAYGGGGPNGRGVLERIARETGGGFYAVGKKQDVEQVFDLIQGELRSQYNLGFVSDKPVRLPEFRKIQLSAKPKGLTVRSRGRYWAKP